MAEYWGDKSQFVDSRKIKTRVAIVGMGSTRVECPYQDRDLEVWGLNEGYKDMPRWDVWFQLHKREIFVNNEKDPEHLKKLQEMTCPIYMQSHNDDIPTSVEYPLNEMIEKYGEQFGGTISYMFALAMEKGFKTIELYGVELLKHTEYAHQKPSLFYLMGIAKERGIKVSMPKQSKLGMRVLYGYEHEDIAEIGDETSKMKMVRADIINATCDIAKMEGFLMAIEEYKKKKLDLNKIAEETVVEIERIKNIREKMLADKEALSQSIERKTGHPVQESVPDVQVY